ncbi:39S ribosomal protein L33, mitochondrial, partial [Rhizophlyctis rosea]
KPHPPKRVIDDVETALPLPLSYKLHGVPQPRPLVPPTKIESTPENPFPYKYYEIALRRGLIGLPEKTRKYVEMAGLRKRYMVVWKPVTPENAGLILRIKELVTVRLVNEIPEKPERPKGFVKVGSVGANKLMV